MRLLTGWVRQITFISIMILAGCVSHHQSIDTSQFKVWKAKSRFHFTSTTTPTSEQDSHLLADLIEFYRLHSYLTTHEKITFDKVLLNTKSQNRVYVFHIVGISDIQAAFEVDEHHILVDNYLISSF